MNGFKKSLVIGGLALFGALSVVPMAQAQDPLGVAADIAAGAFFFGGHNYCWYPDGWQGPGWYWCGYAERQGYGWGGGEGWHGWNHGGHGGPHGGGAPHGGPHPHPHPHGTPHGDHHDHGDHHHH
ncbi:MAG: hypothetical protein ABSC72_06150 [Methylovirgula sp.]|jgi:hypothetical protein